MRFLNPFVLVFTSILGSGYAYLASSLFEAWPGRFLLALPILCIWLVPLLFFGRRDEQHPIWADALQGVAYVSMGWLNFLLFLTIFRDLASLVGLGRLDSNWVLLASVGVLIIGLLVALTGPRVVEVDVAIPDLDQRLQGFRIAQISDLHVSPIIRRGYVQRVVNKVNQLNTDLVVLTGDIVDGAVEKLRDFVAPLTELKTAQRFLILGNHEYYSGVNRWVEHFRSLGLDVLLNSFRTLNHQGAPLHLGGVVDPAGTASGQGPRPDAALGPAGALRILLAHNPKIAASAAPLGFDLMLSGHTHAGQFFPWNLAVRMVHAPHVAGLSREGRMWVYVNPGTGSWGPPIRLGTRPELTVIRLVRAA